MGLPLHTPLGDFIPKPHLRFAAVESGFYAPAVRQVTLCSLTTFSESLRDMGTMGDFIPQAPSLGTSPQTPSPLRAILNV